MENKLFVDTWGWLTLHDKNESKHREVVNFYRSFTSKNKVIYTTDYILDETFTLFFKRLYPALARQSMESLMEVFKAPNFHLVSISEERFLETQKLRVRFVDKPQISFTDLTSMVVMKELGIELVLTGDAHFIQVGMGFKTVP